MMLEHHGSDHLLDSVITDWSLDSGHVQTCSETWLNTFMFKHQHHDSWHVGQQNRITRWLVGTEAVLDDQQYLSTYLEERRILRSRTTLVVQTWSSCVWTYIEERGPWPSWRVVSVTGRRHWPTETVPDCWGRQCRSSRVPHSWRRTPWLPSGAVPASPWRRYTIQSFNKWGDCEGEIRTRN